MGIHRGHETKVLSLLFSVFLIIALSTSDAYAVTTRIPVTMEATSNLFKDGLGTMLNDALSVVETAPGQTWIPAASSAGRVAVPLSKGMIVPEAGILSGFKAGLKTNAASLAVTGATMAALAAVGWVMDKGVLSKPLAGLPSTGAFSPAPGEYYWSAGSDVKYGSASSACSSLATVYSIPDPVVVLSMTSESSGYCQITTTDNAWQGVNSTLTRFGSNCAVGSNYSTAVGGCVSGGPTYAPLVDSDYTLLDGFVKSQDGTWQRGLVDQVCQASTNYAGCIAQMGGVPQLSGPATVSSPATQTQTDRQNANGTTTEIVSVTDTKYGLTYSTDPSPYMDSTPTTTTTTTTTTKNTQNVVISSTTATTSTSSPTTASPTPAPDYSYTDSPFPPVRPFYIQKYPGGFNDVWAKNKAAFDSSAFVTFLNSFVPSFSGSCPSWSMTFNIFAHANFGTMSFGDLCYVFGIVKVIMLVTAMFMCRRLIFGG